MQRPSDRTVWYVLVTLKQSSITRARLARAKVVDETSDRAPDGNRVSNILAIVLGEMVASSREKKEINYGSGNNPTTRWCLVQVYSFGRNDPILDTF